MILPRNHHVTHLIVRDIHENATKHSGREYVLATLRQNYWIPRGRTLINTIIRSCVTCKRLRAQPCGQRMASLHKFRFEIDQPPFTSTGVDCFGPFYVKRGKSQEKRYGCLFTCMTMRAIHLEKLHSMESDSFLNALFRFIARRGVPRRIRSDNGTNFIGGNKELRASIEEWNKDPKVRRQLLLKQIQWEFNPPAASHMGGIWERQIRTVRKVLNAMLRNQVLDDERLSTLFCEIEAIVNDRPLTAVSEDPKDPAPLIPSMMLQLGERFPAPPGNFVKQDVYTRRWRHVQYLANQFWRRELMRMHHAKTGRWASLPKPFQERMD